MKKVRIFFSVICFILSFFLFGKSIMVLVDPDMDGAMLSFSLTLFLLIAGILLKGKSKHTIEIERKKEEFGAIEHHSAHHVEGLPIAEKSLCELYLTPDKLIIESGITHFHIQVSQIQVAEVKTDTEIANIVHSSAMGGIAGGLMFGPIGLVVGARAKNKEKHTFKHYLIINYLNSENEMSAIMFEVMSAWITRSLTTKIKSLIANSPIRNIDL